MAVDFLKKWDDVKKEYYDLTKLKKPRKKLLGVIKTGHTGLESALTKCNKAQDLIGKAIAADKLDAAGKAIPVLEASRQAFVKAETAYVKEIDKAIEAEHDLEATEKTVQERGLKFLKKELAAIAAEIETEIVTIRSALSGGLREEEMAEALVKTWSVAIKAALLRAAAEIAKVKADPTAENYNSRIWEAARNLSPEVTRAKGLPGAKSNPDPLAARLAPYIARNLPAPAQLADDASADDVVREVKAFSAIIKDVTQYVAQTEHYR